MAAPLSGNINVTRKIKTLYSYSRITFHRYNQKRFVQKAVVIPPSKYVRDRQGQITTVEVEPLPEGLDIDPLVAMKYDQDPLRYPKCHPGLMCSKKAPKLPEKMVKNARQMLTEADLICNSIFPSEVEHLLQVYLRRHPPVTKAEKAEKRRLLAASIIAENHPNYEDLDEEKRVQIWQKVVSAADDEVFKTTSHWKLIQYKSRMAYTYLAARLTPNYSVLHHIFQEIQKLDPEFKPSSILNIGSGTGSAVWAANNVWSDIVREYYNCDESSDMNNLARKLLAHDFSTPDDSIIKGAHFRHFLPSPEHSANIFPLVVSAYLLMELPSTVDRLNYIWKMWALTGNYLVLVEHGTRAGYRLIQEAKDFISKMKMEDPAFEGHVLAPCTHDFLCPKLQFKNQPCTFELKYRKLNLNVEHGQGDKICNERFSYVVMKKGPKLKDEKYPRMTMTLHKSKHSHCHVCCPDGNIRHFIFSKNKSRRLYKCVKYSQAGDLLPVLWPSPDSGETIQNDITNSLSTFEADIPLSDSEETIEAEKSQPD